MPDLRIVMPAPASGNLPSSAIKLNFDSDIEGASMKLTRKEGEVMEETMWDPAQLHFHAPSEHTLNGASFVAEMHIVHLPINGFINNIYFDTANQYPNEYAVLGVWFEETDCED